jgi:hypothetical protein
MRKLLTYTLIAMGLLVLRPAVQADVSVAWTSPPDGSTYPVGTMVTPIGQASASGVVGGTGLDLVLVIDESGSMAGAGITAAKAAATALVNALPEPTTSVSVIGFDSSSHTYTLLLGLTSDKATVLSAINTISAGGGTLIGSGIDAATAVLTGASHTAGRSQQMVILSDGFSSGDPEVNAVNAIAAGVDAIHSVGIPGHNVSQMQDIVDGPDNIVGNADDYGVYTGADLTQLVALFQGTSGNLVGIDHVDLTLPDGTFIASVAVDGLGNFSAPQWAIEAGSQTWIATAYDTDGNSASASLELFGQQASGVPDAGSALSLLGFSLVGLLGFARRMAK